MNNKYDVDLGTTLYDANKQLVKQTEKPLTHPELTTKQFLLEDFFEKISKFAMMLCHEQRDYTVFELDKFSLTAPNTAAREVIGCCINRGSILSIEKTDDDIAIEIWISIDDEPYFFCILLFIQYIYFLFCIKRSNIAC